MKTIQHIFKIAIIILLSIFSIPVNGQNNGERKESFEKTYKLNTDGDFAFSCYDTDLKVNTWQKSEVKLIGEIIIKGGKDDDQEKLLEVFKNPEVNKGINDLKIKTNLAKNTISIGPFKKITLVNGKTISLDKYDITYTIWLPESINFNLQSKYNDIEIANLTGKINFDLYDVELTMGSYGKDGNIKMKYSSAFIGKGGDAIMNIYDCDIEALEMENVEIESKYSEFDIKSMQTLDIQSYDDEIRIGNINSLNSEAKYSRFQISNNMTDCLIKFYDSDIDAKDIENLVFEAKYSSLNAVNVKSAKISEMYDSDLRMEIVDKLICNDSKYDDIRINSVEKSVSFNTAYSLTLKIDHVSPSFESFKGDFKYGSVKLPLNNKLDFNLKFEITYGSVDFPKERMKVKNVHIVENGRQSFEGSTTEGADCIIQFKAYDTSFTLK